MSNNVEIAPVKEVFVATNTYHSDRKCQNYDLEVQAELSEDGTITLAPKGSCAIDGFTFINSDPDRVIAIAEMIKGFATMAKERRN